MGLELRLGVEVVVAAIALAQTQEHGVRHEGGKNDQQDDALEGGELSARVGEQHEQQHGGDAHGDFEALGVTCEGQSRDDGAHT
ncbi:Uncharacterised protein [Collinsella intestinalis]|nr:Uncharacterised protein [Collinsella intestinalis]